jgi:hypothetical protein
LAVSSVVAIVGSIPRSYASIPDEDASFRQPAAPGRIEGVRAEEPEARVARPQAATSRQGRVWCPTCGVVESIRQIEPSRDADRHEITIRFRNGATVVLNEATRGSWQLGKRVIVIGGLQASTR